MSLIDYSGPGVLHITNITEARESIEDSNFNTVITVCQSCLVDNEENDLIMDTYINENTKYYYYRMADGVYDNYGGGKSTYNLFESAADTLYNKLSNNETVLIHCHAGQSRSVSVSMAVLGRLLEKPSEEVLNLIQDSRQTYQQPNEKLVKHANKYIEKHTGVKSIYDEDNYY